MAELPALPFWTDAHLADTLHLSNEQQGIYLKFLMVAWRSSECALPDDDAVLGGIARMSPRAWRRMKPSIMAFWELGEDGLWRQKRLTKTRKDVTRWRQQRVDAGKASAQKRASENNAPDQRSLSLRANGTPTEGPTKRQESISKVRTHTIQTRAKSVSDSDFDRIKSAYPKRSGNQPWRKARECINARLAEGYTVEDMLAGANRYAEHCAREDKTGTRFVLMAATFYGRELGFTAEWTPPERPEDAMTPDERRQAQWDRHFGGMSPTNFYNLPPEERARISAESEARDNEGINP